MPTATIPAVGTAMSSRDHDHAHTQPARAPAPITNGNAAPITNEAVAQQLSIGVQAGTDHLLQQPVDVQAVCDDLDQRVAAQRGDRIGQGKRVSSRSRQRFR